MSHAEQLFPLRLQNNRVWRTYSGGQYLEAWQGVEKAEDSSFPEEWIASTVQARNVGREHILEGLSLIVAREGLTSVTLKELIESDPARYLGVNHTSLYGSQTAVLVKALDAGERLTIQVHPDREFAKEVFQSNFGKTEAWFVIGGREIDGEKPYVLLGFKPGITRAHWQDVFERQDIPAMLDCLHRIPVEAGDIFLVEGGIPHAIGSGCFLIEIQEPTDYTLRVERTTPKGNIVPDLACHLGLGFERMLDAFHYETMPMDDMLAKWKKQPSLLHQAEGGKQFSLISNTDTDRFAMDQIEVTGRYQTNRTGTFMIAIILSGSGTMLCNDQLFPVSQSNQWFIPADISEMIWERTSQEKLEVILCYPPQ
jgi:mannose-6-phosphate isomerase